MLRTASIVFSAPKRRGDQIFSAGLILLASCSLLLSGCGMGKNLAGYSDAAPGVALGGKVHGGQQPVTGATITLYAAGSTGYGAASGGSAVLDTTTTDSNGNFSLTGHYNCPASPGDQVYVVATGGNPGTGTNANLALMAGLGSCSTLQANAATTFIFINEATTVASVYALSQFMTNAANVGASNGNYQGLVNAFATINNLVNTSTGSALSVTPAYASNAVPFLNNSTVPQARINTLADIIAACVNSNGTGGSSAACSTLFTAATPSGGSAPTDTVQAMLNIAQNPGLNVSTLFGIALPTSPFQPILAATPNDWTLPVTYTGGGLGVLQGTNGTQGVVQNNGLDIDTNGNIYVAASDLTNDLALVAVFNNQGAALTPATTVNTASPPVITFGGYQENLGNNSFVLPGVLDQSENLWIGDTVIATTPTLSEASSAALTLSNAVNEVAFDALGNIWAAETADSFDEFSGSLGSYTKTQYSVPAPAFRNYLENLTFDAAGNLWANTHVGVSNLYLYNPSNGSITTTYSGATSSRTAADSAGNVYACNNSNNGIDVYNSSVNSGPSNSYSLSLSCDVGPILDGLGNIWVLSGLSTSQSIQELNSSGTLLSPAAGYTGTSSSEPTPLIAPTGSSGQAIDGSGNLWMLNTTIDGAGGTGDVLVEFVGLAAPVVTPHSVALQNGQLATEP